MTYHCDDPRCQGGHPPEDFAKQLRDLTAWKEKAKIVLRGLWLRRNYDRDHPIVIDLTQRAKDLSE